MKKLIFITFYIIMILITVTGCKSSGIKEDNEGFLLHETPQIYELTNEDPFMLMPTVTLYENGNASLSQPMISSVALFETGHYEISGDELIVTYDENTSAVFTITDGGNTLTLKSTRIAFTKIGAVYQYRSTTNFLRDYTKINGEELTLELLRELAKSGQSLTISDFEKYTHVDLDPDYHVFDVEGDYALKVKLSADGNTNCTVWRNFSGDSFPLNLNGSTNLVFDAFLGIVKIPDYEVRKWFDFLGDEEMPWNEKLDLILPEFPGETFTWTYETITVRGESLIWGMPVWNVYLSDLTNDGKPEICATVTIGSGICDTRVIVYDYVLEKEYQLADRMYYDYSLSMEDGKIIVTQSDYQTGKALVSGELRIVNGEIDRFGLPHP